MAESAGDRSLSSYYEKVARRAPRALLIDAAERFAAPGVALDLGCGGGIETRELLRRGWEVVAIDGEPAAFEHLLARVPSADRGRLSTQRAQFADAALPPADLIWAGLSLPFCPPAEFAGLWARIIDALLPGGRFAGDLFGVNHAWRERERMTFVSLEQLQRYLAPLTVELLRESEEARPTAFEGMQHWHGFDFIARK